TADLIGKEVRLVPEYRVDVCRTGGGNPVIHKTPESRVIGAAGWEPRTIRSDLEPIRFTQRSFREALPTEDSAKGPGVKPRAESRVFGGRDDIQHGSPVKSKIQFAECVKNN